LAWANSAETQIYVLQMQKRFQLLGFAAVEYLRW
jgi:hypothetical protein